MVMRFGMSEKLGPRVFGHDQSQPFLGREFSAQADYSDDIARDIDEEIRKIVESAHTRALEILTEHRERLDTVSRLLIKRETIEKAEFDQLLAGGSELEVFGPDDQPSEQSPPEVPSGAADQGRESPRPLPRSRPGRRQRRESRSRRAAAPGPRLSGPRTAPERTLAAPARPGREGPC